MSASITVLCDNTAADPRYEAEHGLSMLLRLENGHRWLWDTGQTDVFLRNAEKLGEPLNGLTGVALSHGHYDHTGGLAAFLKHCDFSGTIHAHSDWAVTRWSSSKGKPRSIGADNAAVGIADVAGINGGAVLDDKLALLTDIPRQEGHFEAVAGFSFDKEGTEPDCVADDACLVLDTGHGPVVILGCCHSGLANTLTHAATVIGAEQFHAVVGGLHLSSAPESAIDEAASVLDLYDVKEVHTGHCSGTKGAQGLSERLPGRVFPLGAGRVLQF